MIYRIENHQLIPQPSKYSKFEKLNGGLGFNAYTRNNQTEPWYFLGTYPSREIAAEAVQNERVGNEPIAKSTQMPYSAACKKLAKSLKAQGLTLRAISARLAAEGFLGQNGTQYGNQSIIGMLS